MKTYEVQITQTTWGNIENGKILTLQAENIAKVKEEAHKMASLDASEIMGFQLSFEEIGATNRTYTAVFTSLSGAVFIYVAIQQ